MNTKSLFPQTQNITYLNTAACGLISKNVLNQKQKDNEAYYNQGSAFLKDEDEIVERTKHKIASIFNVSLDRIGITPNFSLAFNTILNAIDSSATFLYLEDDYPSICLPIQNRDFYSKSIPITTQVEDDIYSHIHKHKPDYLALSKVQYMNGIHIQTSFLQELKQKFPDLKILVDATQYLGVEDFDFENSSIDLLISSGYKWLNAGLGNAIVMMSDVLYENLHSNQIGANSLKDKSRQTCKPTGFLEPGHYDIITIKSLETALDLHYNKLGITQISKTIQDLSKEAFVAFKELNLLDEKVKSRPQHSHIFNLKISEDKFEAFEKANIFLSKRGQGLRVSFHYHNTNDDLNHFLDFLKH